MGSLALEHSGLEGIEDAEEEVEVGVEEDDNVEEEEDDDDDEVEEEEEEEEEGSIEVAGVRLVRSTGPRQSNGASAAVSRRPR